MFFIMVGVYFERILKNSRTSLWMRNLQMGVSSIIGGFLAIYFSGVNRNNDSGVCICM